MPKKGQTHRTLRRKAKRYNRRFRPVSFPTIPTRTNTHLSPSAAEQLQTHLFPNSVLVSLGLCSYLPLSTGTKEPDHE
jgi:hypothetical protein